MRIKLMHLDRAILKLNELTNSPTSYAGHCKDGKWIAQIGNYHLDGAYGGYALHRVVSPGGAINDIFRCGYISKPKLHTLIQAYIGGINDANEERKAA